MLYTNSTIPDITCQQKKPLSIAHLIVEDKIPSRKQRLSLTQFFRKKLDPGLNPEQLLQLFQDMHPTTQKVFAYFMWLLAKGMYIEPSQKYIGKLPEIDRCLRTINGIVAWLKEHKFIDVYTRGNKKTAIYKLSPLFYDPTTWNLLKDTLPIFNQLATKSITFKADLSLRAITIDRGSGSRSCVLLNIKYYNEENIQLSPLNFPKTAENFVQATASRAGERLDAWGEEEHKKILEDHEAFYLSVFGSLPACQPCSPQPLHQPQLDKQTSKRFVPFSNSDWYRAKISAAELRRLKRI